MICVYVCIGMKTGTLQWAHAGGRIVYPAFFSSREVKEMGIDTTKIRSPLHGILVFSVFR